MATEFSWAGSLRGEDMAMLRQEIARRIANGERASTPEEIAAREAARVARKQAELDRLKSE